MTNSDDLARLRAQIARAGRRRKRTPSDPAAIQALRALRTQYAEARLAAWVQKTLDEAPPLSPAQKARVIALFGDRNPRSEVDANPEASDAAA